MTDAIALEQSDCPEVEIPVGAGHVRGLLLHKLMEEVLTGELAEDVERFAARARELLAELVVEPGETTILPDANEIAATAWRTLQLPDIAALRERLIPEWPVYALLKDRSTPEALAGRIDAIAYDGDRADIVIDWKSDVDPSERHARPCGTASGLPSGHGRASRRIGLYDARDRSLGNGSRAAPLGSIGSVERCFR
ncbi:MULTISPECIES: PD-(D/E)XK nuclease family protein [unclassified Bradyrhizobium]